MVAANHGMLVGWSAGSGARDSTFVGRLPITVNSDVQSPVNLNNVGINPYRAPNSPAPGPNTPTTPQTTPTASPDTGSQLSCSLASSTENTVTLRWTRVADATGYRLYIDGRSVSTTGARATEARFGLFERRQYTLRVDALGAPGGCTLTVGPSRSGWVVVR
jgi:hypothetical protein